MRKLLGLVAAAALLALGMAPIATAQQGGKPTQGCDQALENDGDPYDSTCDGSPSQNGKGDGQATGKPCAGCVGAADNKNPKGQLPNGTDPNAGYECDRNQGVGKTNPAHTGCDAYSDSAPTTEAKTIRSSKAQAFDPAEPTDEPALTRGTGIVILISAIALAMIANSRIRRRMTVENSEE